MQVAQKKQIKYLLFFVAYDWDVHNQIEFYTSQCARLSDFELTTIGLYCNGLNPYLSHTCELLKHVKPRDQARVCINCHQYKLDKFTNVFDFDENLFINESHDICHDKEELLDNFETLSQVEKRNIISPVLSIYRVSSTHELLEILGSQNYESTILKYYKSFLACRTSWNQLSQKYPLNSSNTLAIMYNGRFHPYSGLLSALMQNNIDCILHERGTLPSNWRIAKNTVPYDALSLMRWIDNHYNSVNCTLTSQIKIDSKTIDLNSFMKNRYEKGQQNFLDFKGTIELPSNINALINGSKKFVVFYTSSLDEICIFDSTFTYSDQLTRLEELALACNDQGYSLIVRQHPNLGTIGCPTEASYFLKKVRILSADLKFIIVEPDINCHWSYLSRNAAFSIVPYSSLFIDLMYHGFLCMTLGHSAQLGKLTINNYKWHESIENLESLIIKLKHDLVNPEQKRRTKVFAYLYYLASCITVPKAEVKDNYLTKSWSHIKLLEPVADRTIFNKFIAKLLEMNDFPISLTQKHYSK